jgi:hypothetical protein
VSAALVVRLEPAQLAELADQVAERVSQPTGPSLLDRRRLAEALFCGLDRVDSLRRAGMPTIWLSSESPRWDLAAVLEWLRQRPAPENKSEGSVGQPTPWGSAS